MGESMGRFVLAVTAACSLLGATVKADTYVRGYTTKSGTYVAPHYQTSPNSTPYDNYSTKGNVNPYTGQPGTKNPEPSYNYGTGGTNNSLGNPYALPKK